MNNFYAFINKTTTSKAKKYNLIKRKFSNYKITKNSKHGIHLRVALGKNSEIQKLIDNIFNEGTVTVKNSDIEKSSKFNTYILKFNKNYENIQKNDEFYLVNNAPQGDSLLMKKELAPDNLKLIGKELEIKPFSIYKKEIEKAIRNIKYKKIKDLLIHLIEVSGGKKEFDPNFTENISSDDLNHIANDFGEISGAIYLAKKLEKENEFGKVKYIKFPDRSNEPLIDYYILCEFDKLKDPIEIPVSAKSKGGAAPSLIGFKSNFEELNRNAKGKIKKAANIIINIINLPVVDGIFKAAELLEKDFTCVGYTKLKEITKLKTINKDTINNFLNKFKTVKEMLKVIEPYFESMNRRPNEQSIYKLWDNDKNKLFGIISSPLVYHIADIINKIDEFNEILNFIMRDNNINQLHMKLTKKSLEYKVKVFKDYKFKWDPGQISALNPANKKIGFKITDEKVMTSTDEQ